MPLGGKQPPLILFNKSVALCSLLALAGCHDFEELNTNPYAPIYDPTVENVSADGIDIDYTLTEHAMASLKAVSYTHLMTFISMHLPDCVEMRIVDRCLPGMYSVLWDFILSIR